MSASRPDVVVVGGGVIGCATAWALSGEGLSVTLLEREQLAAGASGAAAGMLAPVCEAPEAGPLSHWLHRGLEALESVCAELREQTGVDPEWVPSGALRLARSPKQARGLEEQARALSAEGVRWLAGRELRDVAPGLGEGLLGGLYSPREAHVRSPLLVRALARAAELRGARLRTGVSVTGLLGDARRVWGVETASGPVEAGSVVLCTGWIGAGELAAGPRLAPLPLAPVRGQIVSLDPPSSGIGPILWDDAVYLVPKRDGSLVAGATSERVGADRRVTASGVAGLLAAATRLLPALGDAGFLGAWSGLRPETPDHLPLVGPLDRQGLYVAAGHYRNGVLLSAVTGRMLADGILGKGWSEPAFLPDRAMPAAPDRSPSNA